MLLGTPPSQVPTPQRPTGSTRGNLDFLVVGLGASAGGLDAFRRFFETVPADSGMAYILIQHLDPTHESMMVGLLAGHAPMAVRQAADGMPVEPNQVYVIPPGTYLAIEAGALRLSEPLERHGARLPLDFFLHSLANAYGERAVAVILSGTGGDGSLGLRTIREKGGCAIAQDPEEAAFDGMPRSAIATGCVDRVLPLTKIFEAIGAGREQQPVPAPESPPPDAATPNVTTDQLAEIVELLRSRAALDFAPYKEGTLLRRIERRMMAAGIADWAAYIECLRGGSEEAERLAQDLLINVTHFFRDTAAFESLATGPVADLVRTHPLDRPLRIWVSGSSTGEEAYSLAMLFLEAIETAKRPIKLQLFASDIDKEALATARAGLYPEAVGADVSPARLARFFTREPAGYRVVPELRGAVVFTIQDVLSDPPFARLDMISCRNLLIYLRPDSQKRVLQLFHFALRDGGVLFLGSSETVAPLDDRFEAIDKLQRIYRRIGHSRPGDVDFSIAGGGGARPGGARTPVKTGAQSPGLGELVRGLVLETYAPASVLINRRNEILYTLGPADRYLRVAAGEPSLDLLTMVSGDLHTKLLSAIQRAGHGKERVSVTGAKLSHGGDTLSVRVDVQPMRGAGEELLAVSFIDEPTPQPRPPPAPGGASDPARVAELEGELGTVRAELQGAIRNLEIANQEQKAINEEAMSINEEYQSANEELETSKEELQSLNEELTALNNQLRETIEQQRATAADLQNILNSSDVATLFLDHRLNIRFFTPAAKALFAVIATDIGRPLSDLARRFDDPDLLVDTKAVLATTASKKRDVLTDAGAWLLRRVLPYHGPDGRTEGVVITFVDISEIKAAEQELVTARAYAESIIDTVHQPLLVLDRDLRVISANHSFFRLFGLNPEATVGWHLAAFCNPPGDSKGLREFLTLVRRDPAPIEDYEIEVDLPSLGRRQLLVNARNIPGGRPEEPLILLAIDDITERKGASAALEAAKQVAEHANIAKSRFLAAASHDLRQPLQTLTLLQALLAKKVTNVGAMELVRRFGDSLNTMSSMLNTLLDINQLDAGIVQTRISSFAIGGILERLRVDFGYHTAARGLIWRVVDCGAVVRSDPHLLEQIIRNLLSNAVKYTTEGRVLLGCRRRGGTLLIEIWDTGIGIPPAQLEAIFEEYRQLDNAARERSKGLGLGLTIVQRLANMLGHAVDVRSVPGKGSRFSIEVPIAAGEEGRAHPPTHNRLKVAANALAGNTVMIIEDDPATREALYLLFSGEGYRTQTFADGAAMLELAARGGIRPDIIIADYNLPGALTGAKVVQHLRQATSYQIPAIILTGDISVETLREISRLGCLRLSKPVLGSELLHLTNDLLSGSSAAAPAPPPEPKPRIVAPASEGRLTVFVVDDDEDLRETMRALLETEQRVVETYPSAEAFLEAWSPGRDGCLVVDAHMGGMSGIELIEHLAAGSHTLPAILITGFGDVRMAVLAMKAGAVDFIEKPVCAEALIASIDRAIALPHDQTKTAASRQAAAALAATLTERQRQIMDLVLAGCPSKIIAADLGISQRTVENHRAAIMRKTGSKSLPALARRALGLA